MNNERYQRGKNKLNQLDPDSVDRLINNLKDICPDLAKFIIEFPFGDIYSRPGLDIKSRMIATIASLVTLGNAKSQLKTHINNALNVGLTKEEIVEIILQMAVYAGFPATLNAMYEAKEVFNKKIEK